MGAHSAPTDPSRTATMIDRETAEDLYQSTMDGTYETSGDVDSPTSWFALVPRDDRWYLLIHDTLGFTHGYLMGSEDHAREVYADLESEYAAWLNTDCKEN